MEDIIKMLYDSFISDHREMGMYTVYNEDFSIFINGVISAKKFIIKEALPILKNEVKENSLDHFLSLGILESLLKEAKKFFFPILYKEHEGNTTLIEKEFEGYYEAVKRHNPDKSIYGHIKVLFYAGFLKGYIYILKNGPDAILTLSVEIKKYIKETEDLIVEKR